MLMVDFFDMLPGSSNKPVRRDVQVRLKADEGGKPVTEPVEAESFTLSDEGSLDDLKIIADRFYHCGCNANHKTLGGRCREEGCFRDSCVDCFRRCHSCHVPLCSLHRKTLQSGTQSAVITLCPGCHATASRKRMLRTVVRAVLSPFISFQDSTADE